MTESQICLDTAVGGLGILGFLLVSDSGSKPPILGIYHFAGARSSHVFSMQNDNIYIYIYIYVIAMFKQPSGSLDKIH